MRQFGLIGFPLSHSFSKKYFTEKFAAENISNAEFLNFSLENISEIKKLFIEHPQLKGLSVTIPHKKNVIVYLDEISDVVKETGACNCIKIQNNKKTGFNTDVIGFEKSFTKKLQPFHTKALILGTGGAAVAVEYVLKKINIQYKFVSRNKEENNFIWEDLNEEIINENLILINCTPLGTYPKVDEAPAIPYEFLSPKHYLFDLVYNPPLTKFLANGKNKNCTIENGHEMLVLQAEENWQIWNE